MARGRRFIRSNNNPPGVDIDARRVLLVESRLEPRDNYPIDGLTIAQQTRADLRDYQRKQQPARPVTMAARPVLCHCGSRSFYMRGVRWVCSQCQPQPAQPLEARAVVTMPTLSAETKKELAQAWDLINKKRAADGLEPMPEIAAPAKVYPVDVVFYAELGIEAARRRSLVGGGWRLWQLGKALDRAGTGRVKRDDLRAFVLSLGVNPRSFDRWIINARNNDFISDVQSATGEWIVILHNAGIVGAAMDSDKLSRRVSIPAAALIGKGWKARIFAAYETIYNGQPITRGRMQIICNVSRSTQKYREAQANVKVIRNIAQLEESADKLPMIREYARNPFAFYLDGRGGIIQRLPNSYQYTQA